MEETLWLVESPVYQGTEATVPYSIAFEGVTTIASPSITVYKGGADVTSTVMPSGSHSTSGNVLTMKPLTALVNGSEYVISIVATADGVAKEWFLAVRGRSALNASQ